MLLFRSEEHIARWLEQRGLHRGATMSVEQGWRLGRTWYEHRMDEDWLRPTLEEAQRVFEGIGLTGPFWRLS